MPRARVLCDDLQVLGSAFYLMDFVDGRIFWDPSLPDATPADRAAIYGGIIDAMAALHTIDPAAVGLADFGKPGNYFERQLRRWTEQSLTPAARRVSGWLARPRVGAAVLASTAVALIAGVVVAALIGRNDGPTTN